MEAAMQRTAAEGETVTSAKRSGGALTGATPVGGAAAGGAARATVARVAEFERQVGNLVRLGYPGLSGLDETAFRQLLAPLKEAAAAITPEPPSGDAYHVGFVLVVNRGLVDPEKSVALLTLPGKTKPGVVDRNYKPGDIARFVPTVDTADVYLVTNVERGEEFRNVRPEDATKAIISRNRTPLTIEEGIAFATQFPDALAKNNCFMLAGSRCGDRRVPALWISENAPKLGWCWDGNPHTWLGTASTESRVTA